MTGGSQQLRQFRIAMRDGATVEAASELAGISITEARLTVKADEANPPPPEAYELLGHNKGPTMAETTDDRLRLLIERVERLEEEKKGIADDIKDIYVEAKAVGYDVKIMRQIVRLRKMPPDDRKEMEALLDTYKCALGMDYAETPLGRATIDRAAQSSSHETSEAVDTTGMSETELYAEALKLVIEHQKASTSWLQRRLRLGYNSAAELVEKMERHGIVGAPNHVGKRDVLAVDADAALLKAISVPLNVRSGDPREMAH